MCGCMRVHMYMHGCYMYIPVYVYSYIEYWLHVIGSAQLVHGQLYLFTLVTNDLHVCVGPRAGKSSREREREKAGGPGRYPIVKYRKPFSSNLIYETNEELYCCLVLDLHETLYF
jgi:hypothetical protein